MKVVAWLLVGVVVLVAILSLDPAVIGLSATTPVLQLIALRGVLAVAAAGLGVLLLLVAALARRTRGRARRTLVLGVVLLLVGIGHGGVLVERGVTDAGPPPISAGDAIDVLTLNTEGAAAGTDALARLVADEAPDVVALQEIAEPDAQAVADATGLDYQVFADTTGTSPVQATALLVSAGLGEYEQASAPATTFATVWAQPVSGDGPSLLSVHTVPPIPGDVGTWGDELDRLLTLCDRVDGLVMAGDYNATRDHAPMRGSGCVDAAAAIGGIGTWPAQAPRPLGTAIDHVLVDGGAWTPDGAGVLDVPGGDHRAVLVRLAPA